ncbi:PAP2 superfamily-domain-containing protein [Aspergillus floccosus]
MGILRNLLEPGAIVATFTVGTLINRRKPTRRPSVETPLLNDDSEIQKPDDQEDDDEITQRNRDTIQSRILASFPFLLEIWYWILTYWIYQGLRAFSAKAIAGNEAVFKLAERHAHEVLALEHLLHIDIELSLQQSVLDRYPWLMDIFARVYYSHIVLGVVFLVYSYTYFPANKYQAIRRTLAFENVIAFVVLTLWRCAPPRLLPEEDGFTDVLHSNKGGSSWTQNSFQLTIAAMPSLHFGNAVFIAFCLLKFSPHWYLRVIAPIWPVLMGSTIFATANHFILDAVVGVCVTFTAYRFNRAMLVLLPVERVVFRLLRIEKPDYYR